jgi:SAM-dependent methyltransferase
MLLGDAESDIATDTSADTAADADDYCIRAGYVARPVPEYYADTPSGITWQPDVYPEAQRVARLVGARTIVDLGSGNGAKLATLHPEFRIVGVDIGSNLQYVRAHHPQGTWIEHDFEQAGPLPLDDALLADSVVVCADVIEHLMDPLPLLAKLHDAFERGAAAVLLSTPERTHTWGADHAGPPPNTCHVREWTIEELGALLDREGFAFGDLELTRSNDAESRLATTLALLYRDADVERLVRAERDARAAA